VRERVTETISMPKAHREAFRRFADEHYGGNRSAAFRALLERDPVTKALLPLAGQTT
jgi:hypothetical protein